MRLCIHVLYLTAHFPLQNNGHQPKNRIKMIMLTKGRKALKHIIQINASNMYIISPAVSLLLPLFVVHLWNQYSKLNTNSHCYKQKPEKKNTNIINTFPYCITSKVESIHQKEQFKLHSTKLTHQKFCGLCLEAEITMASSKSEPGPSESFPFTQ